MFEKVLHFIKYNNAFTIIIVIFLFSFGVSFAASEDVRDSVYASAEKVISVDNGLIVSTDLDNFNFDLRIKSVTEDEKNYYATYSYRTLTVEDSIWQNKEAEKTLTVSKEALDGKDFGLYLAKELGENMNYELSYLKRVQKLEKEAGESEKVVATAYSGLIGRLFDPKEEVIEGYNPVIPQPSPEATAGEAEVPATVESRPEEVIVSTPPSSPPPSPEPEVTPAPPTPVVPEATSTPLEVTPVPELTPTPAPEEMVDEKLVQEVVDKLLQDEATSTPTE